MTDTPDQTALRACLERLCAGDPAARAEALTLASTRLLRLARRMLRANPKLRRLEDTDDLHQAAAVRLMRALEAVRPATVADFFRLAALQMRRELIDLARHHHRPFAAGRAVHRSGDGTDENTLTPDQADTTHEPERLARWTEFHALVDRLPPEDREAFDLLWYHDLPLADVAALLGVSERTVQRRWRSARARLADLLGEGTRL